MAWTYVRPVRESFALPTATRSTQAVITFSRRLWGARTEISFPVVIGLQLLEFWLLNTRGPLEIAVAACLSGSLLAGAVMFTRQKQPLRQPFAAVASPLVPCCATSKLTPLVAQTNCYPIALEAQSQTWVDLMARISHELRTPLNAVIGFSDLMERELFGPLGNARYRDYAAHIKSSGDAVLRSAEDTLALSSLLATQPENDRMQITPLVSLARDAWFAIEPLAIRRGVTLAITIPDRLEVAGKRRALRQALSNLMQEAVQRAIPESSISIAVELHGATARILVIAAETERNRYPDTPSTALCVARALLELQGTALQVTDHPTGCGWMATTVLDLSVQSDFFLHS